MLNFVCVNVAHWFARHLIVIYGMPVPYALTKRINYLHYPRGGAYGPRCPSGGRPGFSGGGQMSEHSTPHRPHYIEADPLPADS